ncbi:flotillin family protein [bacterium LRH843]|nr:flotillin family protein [bacterium LRH843]
MLPFIIGGVALLVVIVGILLFIAKYRTVGPDQALIVTGSGLGSGGNVVATEDGKRIKIIRGGGTFVVPVLQQAETLSLLNHKLEISSKDTMTKTAVPVNVLATVIIKVGSPIEAISTAAEQYLGKSEEELRTEAIEVLSGHLRTVVAVLTPEQVYGDRESFSSKVLEVAQPDLTKMGLQIISFTIKDISDSQGYFKSLGEPQIALVKRDAQMASAERDKEARIEIARAEQEAKEQENQREAQIANAVKEKELKVQAYKKEQEHAKADADLAYELQTAIARQKVTEETMRVQIIEREKQIELEEKEIQRREKQYDADVKKKADADRYAVEQAAEAEKIKQMKQAEADQYKIEAEAKGRAEEVRVEGLARADIEKAQGIATAEAERAKGNAEADIIRAKGLAEAEAKQKIAEAFELYGQAAIMDMVIKMLPEYAKEVASPLGNIDKITVVDTGGNGKNSGAGKVTGYATDLMASLQETLKASSGIDMKELLESYAGKGNVRQSIDNLADDLKEKKTDVTISNEERKVEEETN